MATLKRADRLLALDSCLFALLRSGQSRTCISSWRSNRCVGTTSSPSDTSLRLVWCSSCSNCIILFVSIRIPDFFIGELYRQQSTELLHALVSGYQLDGGEHVVIPDIIPVHLGMDGSFDMK
nr:hypothetical protein [Tanacetum cinerariifolium]